MPIERHPISVSQFCELLALDPARFYGVERGPRGSSTLTILMEPDMAQTSGTIPQLTTGGKRIGAKGGGKKKGC
jgi:hypothetical protein